jgi:hypothetical protein
MNTQRLRLLSLATVVSLSACRARPADPEELAAAERSASAESEEGSSEADAVAEVPPAPDAGVVTSDVRVRLTTVEGSGLPPQVMRNLSRPSLQPQNIRVDGRLPAGARISPRLTPVRPANSVQATGTTGTLQLRTTGTPTPAPAPAPAP